ncbi:alpha/beta hydrolase [Lachnoclostridium phytofermentans]|uniref:Dipeptidyl aminopeptidase/acylaminoacyl-peptidase-like protein n=1 Tax=Lachnoclostridium phytofermentans (strain ATCC 700394 / DSM 18823 / ISDg) TaxID=357809 RepID=A9KPB2_LACP7|nr:alpha/beta fold hydrolase [Lachnoclostridium phytofermentans]ABX41774.1 dipeptidyl aminopeptidase/acylaminoacyl-peptidase-like protein [Lachnoclostridium phytofermentans ISDg]
MNIMLVLFLVILIFLVGFCTLAFCIISRAHREQFKRADYDINHNSSLTYCDFSLSYPRETLKIPSGKYMLNGYLYGMENKNGLIILSSGHRNSTEASLLDMKYFVDNGWMVLCYDYTGYYNSEGKNMTDYTQAVRDLDAVLSYLEKLSRFNRVPFLLYGHSLGAYVSAAVLKFNHKITAVVAASGFDKPIDQWNYSIKRFSGRLGTILGTMASIYLYIIFGKDTVRFSAVDGINSTDIPLLIISGTEDVYYGGKSPIYTKRNQITNSNCSYILMDKERHNGHFDYIITDNALDYQKLCKDKKISQVDKWLIMERDKNYHDMINKFFLSAKR